MVHLAKFLFAPASVAIVGASDDASKTSGRPLRFLRQAGYEGRVYPVNPRRETVLGERAWRSIEELPEAPEHAFILAQTDQIVETAEACGKLGVKVATVLASGFAETDEEGSRRISRLQSVCRDTGLRILGPSSIGAANLHNRFVLTANAAFAEADLPAGGVFVASHSGSMMGALVSRGKARRLGFAGLVSVGNELDLTLGEICSATLDDPNITGYLLFLENLRAAERLRSFARAAAARNKPVVAYKLGRSQVGAELALSHTGAMAGADDVADAFLVDSGIARVETFEGLIESLPLLSRVPIAPKGSRKPTVGVVTTTGGGAAMIVDQLSIRDITVLKPSTTTFDAIDEAGLAVDRGRIVDLTLAGTRYPVMKASLDAMLADPALNLVVAVVGSSARFQPELAVRPIIDCANAAKPIAAFIVPDAPEALAMLANAGVPSFRTPEACADAVNAAFRRKAPRQHHADFIGAPTFGRMLDEVDSYSLVASLGIQPAPFVVIEPRKELPTLPFEYPVAAKILSAEISHKTDIGGVVLGIGDQTELAAALERITGAVGRSRPGVSANRVLVQKMINGLGEALIGFRRDPEVGPIVMLAAGGIATELYKDTSIRMAPVDIIAAHEMIEDVKGMQLFAGFRGRPRADLNALASAIVALSRLAETGDIVEAEINPLILTANGVFAVDAVVHKARETGSV